MVAGSCNCGCRHHTGEREHQCGFFPMIAGVVTAGERDAAACAVSSCITPYPRAATVYAPDRGDKAAGKVHVERGGWLAGSGKIMEPIPILFCICSSHYGALPILFCISSSHYGSFHMLPISTSYTFLYH